ncbi:MAG: arsenite efflux transporter metallochaperone ArsD [Verrucomicrobiales bacterium]
MKVIQIYDPPMCCSTGICGTEIDPDLVSFAAMLSQFADNGIAVERYNLGQQPMAFVENAKVKAFLESDGAEALPLIFWDGEFHSKGHYPTKEERLTWYRAAHEKTEVPS